MDTSRRVHWPAIDSWRLALCVVVLAALALRLYGLNWDEGADLHPDELFIAKIVLIDRIHLDWPLDLAQLLDPARSGLNPRSVDPSTGQFREFAYGALPLFVTDFVAWILSRLSGTNWNAMDHAFLVGRSLSALLSALTILPIAALGRAVGGRAAGLLAALMAAFAPMSIQLAHFFTTDSWLTFFVAYALLACAWAAARGGVWRFAAAGSCFGLAMATKGSVFSLVVPLVVALSLSALSTSSAQGAATVAGAFLRNALAAAAGALLAFAAFEPYALFRPDVYLQSLRTQADIVSGSFDVPFTRVYVGTTPILYQLEQFVLWGYGLVAGLLALLGLGLIVVIARRKQSLAALILLSWTGAYAAVLLVSEAKFLRYLEPLTPVFAVGAGVSIALIDKLSGRITWEKVSRLVVPLVLALCAGWTAAFLTLYAHENPRVAATKWIYATAPPGSALTAEYWDDALPRSLTYSLSPPTFGYSSVQLDLYRDLPPRQASSAIYHAIERADYTVQSSERVSSAVAAAPWRYPVQQRYFDLLQRGQLGFQPAVRFERAPAVGSLTLDDRHADESFVNYDHPRVAIYTRTATLERSTYDDEMAWALQRPWFPRRDPPYPTLLLDRPVGENPSVDDARWSSSFTSVSSTAVVTWVALLIVLAIIGRPIARSVFASFPDAGWGLARLLALLISAYAVWLGASLQLFQYRAVWVVLALLVTGLIAWRSRPRPNLTQFSFPRGLLYRPWFHAEAAFWLVFALFFAFRLANPDSWHPLWGGEKPMEFAQINAIGRSAYFPPYDPWFSDGYINYYYYGFYLVSFLLKATGIPLEIGFNLAQPTVMALLATASFSVAAAISARLTRLPRLGIAGGWVGVLTVCLIGNLSALRGLLSLDSPVLDPFLYWTWNGSRAIDNVITEFPFFSGLYADLHAHVVALPLTVLVIALCFAQATNQIDLDRFPRNGWLQEFTPASARVALLALTLGSLFATNAWDVPVYATLAVATVFMATAEVQLWWRRVTAFAFLSLFIVAGSWLLFLPFHQHYVALFNQLAFVHDPTDLAQFLTHFGGLISICALGLAVMLARNAGESRRLAFLEAGALLLAVAGLTLLASGRSTGIAAAVMLGVALAGPPLFAAWWRATDVARVCPSLANGVRFIVAAAAVTGILSLLADRSVLGLLVALGGAASAGWLVTTRPAERFVSLLLAAGFFTAAGAEVVVVADDLIDTVAYRMNTVFKFYNQVWVLLGIAAACLIAMMLRDALAARLSRQRADRPHRSLLAPAELGLAIAVALIAASLTYPALATGPRLAQRFEPGTPVGTLDAFAWMRQGTVPVYSDTGMDHIDFRGDLAAIDWLLANVKGTPVIAEASIGPYRCNGSRISIATGLPTIIGWERHEQQQRYPDMLPQRVDDVRTLYTSTDPNEKAAILYRYNVAYVIVGPLERLYPVAEQRLHADRLGSRHRRLRPHDRENARSCPRRGGDDHLSSRARRRRSVNRSTA